jgi:hypothetical protein
MKRHPAIVIGVVIGLYLAAVSFGAHHEPDEVYDFTKPFTLKGVVTEFIRANPHAFILIDVKAGNGATQTWAVEGDAPNSLTAGGWNPSTLKRGDTISITVFPAKPGVRPSSKLVIPTSPPALVALLKRVAEQQNAHYGVHGAEVTLSGGRKLLFGHRGRYWGITR